VRFRAIRRYEAEYPVRLMCRVLEVSRGGYYAWRRRGESWREARNRQLLQQIREVHATHRRVYGSPRIYAERRSRGILCGRNRVTRLMRAHGIRARGARRFRATTKSEHAYPVAPNLLAREFQAEGANQRWAGDITYVWTREGWLYLAVILDLYSRKVVGWAIGERVNRELTLRALAMALETRSPRPRLLHHSDRGGQYACGDYRKKLEDRALQCSMSRRGDCYDNAVVEAFFASLKKELIHQEEFFTRRQARVAIFRYIEGFYNSRRRHSYLGYVSPEEFERRSLET
jgi:putative transposase